MNIRSVLIAALLALSAQAEAAVITVNDNTDPVINGPADALPDNCLPDSGQPCRLRDAVALARGGDTIVFAPHVTMIELFHALEFRDRSGLPVTVDGGGRVIIVSGPDQTTLHAIRTAGPRASNITILRGLTIYGMQAGIVAPKYACGGALVNLGQLRISDSFIKGEAFMGGGLCNYGLAWVERSTIIGTAWWSGGAIHNSGVLEMSNSSILGTFVYGEQGIIENLPFVTGWGAGLYNHYGTARLDFVTFGRSQIQTPGDPMTMRCGAQVFNRYGDVSIDRSIISTGYVSKDPDDTLDLPVNQIGVCGYPDMTEAPTRVSRSVIEMSGSSQAWAHPQWVIDGGGNHDIPWDQVAYPIYRPQIVEDTGTTFTRHGIPRPWIHGVVRDAVDCADAPATDQRGVPRPQGGLCDMGAVELQ